MVELKNDTSKEGTSILIAFSTRQSNTNSMLEMPELSLHFVHKGKGRGSSTFTKVQIVILKHIDRSRFINHSFSPTFTVRIRVILGGPPKIFGVLCPPFYCIFINKFSKIRNLEYYVRQFFSKNFPKFSENFLKFFNFFKIEKNYYFCTQNSPKSLYLLKFGQIFP